MMNEPGTEAFKDFFINHRHHFFGYDFDDSNWEKNYEGTDMNLELKKSIFNLRGR
jgi:hypothetical protein